MRTAQEDIELIRLLELDRAEKCRSNFYAFCRYMDPEFFSDNKPHLKEIAEAFQEVADGKINKLAISLPPRAGKSYITSMFCAWWIGNNPKEAVMRNSYGAELAETFSYFVRGLMTNDKYLKVFPKIKLKKDKQSIDDWALETAKQTTYFCGGVGGPLTGKGAKLLILDDPIKGIEEAMSETIIEKTWNWYGGVHMARREKNYINIHIATRWSRKDPIGRLTDPESQFYDPEFKVIKIPALNEKGESYCEALMSTQEYIEQKQLLDDFIWEAEFMQNPIESKGLLFPIEELNRFSMGGLKDKKPDGIIGYTDTADRGDDFLCSLIGKRYGDYTYVTDVVFTQDGVEITEPLVAQQIIDSKCEWMVVEANNGGHQYARNVRKLTDPKWKCSISDQNQNSNKETRILMNAGYIKEFFYFRDDYEPGSDYDKFIRALTSYVKLGKNKHDDAPDAVTGLAEIMRYITYSKPKPKPIYNFSWEKPKPDPTGYGEAVTVI